MITNFKNEINVNIVPTSPPSTNLRSNLNCIISIMEILNLKPEKYYKNNNKRVGFLKSGDIEVEVINDLRKKLL
jgi:hypothetical protein